jgi:hypothetical protein
MRLGALLLTPAVLTAQAHFPWDAAIELPWETTVPVELPEPLPPEPVATPACMVSLTGDGTLHIVNDQGRIALRIGLPGRPVHILRDAGTALALTDFPQRFPLKTPLSKGLGSVPLLGNDFRSELQGLLWIVDDSQKRLTIVHPATRQVIYLPLPAGNDWEPCFFPDRLEIREILDPSVERRERICWSLPWLVLVPQFVKLSRTPLAGRQGTAFHPFPSE